MKEIRKHKEYLIVASIFIFAGLIDILLRSISGTSIMDTILGKNFENSIYSYVWFKAELFWSGELWRVITWPLFSKGIVYYIVEGYILITLLKAIQDRIESKRLYMIVIGLVLLILFGSYFSYCDLYGDFSINYGIVGMMPLLFGLAGIYFTLKLIDRVEPDSNKNNNNNAYQIGLIILYLLYQVVMTMMNGTEQYIMYHSFSIGMFMAFILRLKNLTVMKKSKTQIYKTFNIKNYPFTFVIITLCLLSFILNIVTFDQRLMIQLYEEASLINWFKFFLFDGDYGYVASALLSNTELIKSGQVWRVFTHVFSHTGLIHIMTNIPAIYFSGRLVEDFLGAKKTLVIYMASAFVLSLFTIIEGIETTTMGGSSLSAYALFAIYLIIRFRADNAIYGDRIGFIYVTSYFILGNIPSIGNFGEAHLTSYMIGMLSIAIIIALKKDQRKAISISY